MGLKSALAGLLLVAPLALAHPHPGGGREKVYAHAAVPRDERHLGSCKKRFEEEEFQNKRAERHGDELMRLRRDRGFEAEDSTPLHKRDYLSVSKIDHKSNKAVSFNMKAKDLFADAGACMLMAAVDQGPLYVAGEEVRKEITEGQAGIKMTVAIEVVDVATCQPVTDAYVDIWSSNATGVYMGVMGYPGMGDPRDTNMLKGTAMRGVQPVDQDGIAVFDTLMPGHYEGRTTHIHAIVYLGAKKQANNTITGGHAAHVGQLYFDQGLLTSINGIAPYSSITMQVLPNVRDTLFMMGSTRDDPIMKYALVGNKLEDGLYSWIRFGINSKNTLRVSPAAYWTEKGGVMNPTGPVAQMNGGRVGGGGFGGQRGG